MPKDPNSFAWNVAAFVVVVGAVLLVMLPLVAGTSESYASFLGAFLSAPITVLGIVIAQNLREAADKRAAEASARRSLIALAVSAMMELDEHMETGRYWLTSLKNFPSIKSPPFSLAAELTTHARFGVTLFSVLFERGEELYPIGLGVAKAVQSLRAFDRRAKSVAEFYERKSKTVMSDSDAKTVPFISDDGESCLAALQNARDEISHFVAQHFSEAEALRR